MPLAGFDELYQDADRRAARVAVAVAGGADRTVIEALHAAAERGWVKPLVVGREEEIRQVANQCGPQLQDFTLVDSEDPAAQAVALVRSGQAAVVVSVVHIQKASGGRQPPEKTTSDFMVHSRGLRPPLAAPFELDGKPVPRITAYLFHAGGHDNPATLKANADKSFQGSILLGMGFTFDDTDKDGVASPLAEMHRLIEKDPRNAERIFPYIGGEEVNDSPTHAHHAAMDRAVLDAYGWSDLQPTCEFLLDYEEEEEDTGGLTPPARQRKKPWRYRWPDEVRDEVLARLLELNKRRAAEEKMAGAEEKPKKRERKKPPEGTGKEAMQFVSSSTRMVTHPAYQRIIGMGKEVLPLLFAELRREPDHWFWALRAITGENPVAEADAGKLGPMTAAWLRWAEEHGY